MLTLRLDTSNLNRGITIMQRFTRRTPAQAANSAAYMVATFTYANMPVILPGQMDTELQVTTTPIVQTTGVRKGSVNITGNVARTEAMMIVVARMHPDSKYNQLTGGYWAINNRPDFGSVRNGLGGIAFWNWVEQADERMVKARHSSSAFLKSCWIPALNAIRPFVAPSLLARINGGGAFARPNLTIADRAETVEESGWGKPAREGSVYAVAEIANAAGVTGPNAVLAKKHNDALWRVTPPVLQRAINDVADMTFKEVIKRELEAERAAMGVCGWRIDV